jgi:hypothetical protein
MVRRKRDDDSSNVTFNSSSFGGGGGIIPGGFHNPSPPSLTFPSTGGTIDGASTAAESQPSLAYDASSMSAAGSFGAVGGHRRPYKRRRKTLTDALQQINLNRDVPNQILDGGGGAVGGINCGTISDVVDGDDSSLLVNRGTSSSGGRDLDDDDDDDDGQDGASGLLLGLNGAGDYDDNSQLTASDDDDDVELHQKNAIKAGAQQAEGKPQSVTAEMDAADVYLEDDDDTDLSSIMNTQTDVEKAQRKAMLDLLLGKSRTVFTFPGKARPVVSSAVSAVDRQIEELLRKSLQNVQQGVHPLVINQTTPAEDDDDDETTLWPSQDDMAIDPRIYHNTSRSTTTGGTMMDRNNNNEQSVGSMLPPPTRTRKRSNSLPRSMDLDSEYENHYSTAKKRSHISSSFPMVPTWPQPADNGMARNQSNNGSSTNLTSTGTSDIDMD